MHKKKEELEDDLLPFDGKVGDESTDDLEDEDKEGPEVEDEE